MNQYTKLHLVFKIKCLGEVQTNRQPNKDELNKEILLFKFTFTEKVTSSLKLAKLKNLFSKTAST